MTIARSNGRTPLRLAILISGRGTNMTAIARACAAGRVHARIALVIADRPTAAGLEAARALGLPVQLVAARDYADRDGFESALMAAIDASGAELVVLAGFMRILGERFTTHYAGRMLNIHPALLPAYRGLHTHQRVLEAGDRVHGPTVHFVTAELDGGPLIAQTRILIADTDTATTLSARVQHAEYILYPTVIGWFADGELELRGSHACLRGQPLLEPVQVEVAAHDGVSV